MSKEFGKKLKELRNEKSISQQTLANYFCVSKMTISAWENNKQEPCIDDIIKLAKYFNTTIDYIVGYDSDEKSKEFFEYTDGIHTIKHKRD